MAKHVARDVYILVNGTNISSYANSCEITDEADDVELSAFGPAGYKEYGVGLKDANVAATLYSDFDTLHGVLQPLYSTSGTFSLEVRATSAARGTANPAAVMTARLFAYSPIKGGLGDAATFDCTFRNASTAGLTWATS